MTTIEQILAEETAAEATTKAVTIDGHDYTVADLRKVSDKLFNKADWKAAWAAAVPHQIVPIALAAAEWFQGRRPTIHGIQPLTGKVILSSDGYAA
jgi:hypothetical protein